MLTFVSFQTLFVPDKDYVPSTPTTPTTHSPVTDKPAESVFSNNTSAAAANKPNFPVSCCFKKKITQCHIFINTYESL